MKNRFIILIFLILTIFFVTLYSIYFEYSVSIPFDMFSEDNLKILENCSCVELNLLTVSKMYNPEISIEKYAETIKKDYKLNVFGLDFDKLQYVNREVNQDTVALRIPSDREYIKFLLEKKIPVFLEVFNFNYEGFATHSILITGYEKLFNRFSYFDSSVYLSAHLRMSWKNKFDRVKSKRMEILNKKQPEYKEDKEIDENAGKISWISKC